MILVAAKDWLSQPPPPAPGRLWDNDTGGTQGRVPHRMKTRWSESRDLTVVEEHYAVEEALRASHLKLWRDLWQSREELVGLVEELQGEIAELEAENRKLRMNPGPS